MCRFSEQFGYEKTRNSGEFQKSVCCTATSTVVALGCLCVAMARRAALVSLAFLLVGNGWSPLGGCLARIKKVSVDERGVTAVLVSEAFGMAAGGRIKFDVDLNYDQDEEDLAPRYGCMNVLWYIQLVLPWLC